MTDLGDSGAPERDRETLWRLLCDLQCFTPFTDKEWGLVRECDNPTWLRQRHYADAILAEGFARPQQPTDRGGREAMAIESAALFAEEYTAMAGNPPPEIVEAVAATFREDPTRALAAVAATTGSRIARGIRSRLGRQSPPAAPPKEGV